MIHGIDRSLRVHRQLSGFLTLWQLLRDLVPASTFGAPLVIPFTVPASWNLRVVFTVLPGVLLAFAVYGVATGAETLSVILLIAIAVLNIAIGLRETFLKFQFGDEDLTVVYPLHRRHWLWTDLEDAQVIDRGLDIALLMTFRGKTIQLSDNHVVIAPEQILEGLQPILRRGRRATSAR